MLAGNADRERALDVLRAAYAEGRLTDEEHAERSGRALSARTVEELQQLTADVPQGPAPGPAPPPGGLPVPGTFHGPVPYQGPYPVQLPQPGPYQGLHHPSRPMYHGPVYPPAPVYPFVPQPVPYRPTNAAATGSLVCGLVTPLTLGISGLPAVILGHKARAEIRRTGERGDGTAVAGLALGWLALGILLMVLIFS